MAAVEGGGVQFALHDFLQTKLRLPGIEPAFGAVEV
jgi:hypothetical protein